MIDALFAQVCRRGATSLVLPLHHPRPVLICEYSESVQMGVGGSRGCRHRRCPQVAAGRFYCVVDDANDVPAPPRNSRPLPLAPCSLLFAKVKSTGSRILETTVLWKIPMVLFYFSQGLGSEWRAQVPAVQQIRLRMEGQINGAPGGQGSHSPKTYLSLERPTVYI